MLAGIYLFWVSIERFSDIPHHAVPFASPEETIPQENRNRGGYHTHMVAMIIPYINAALAHARYEHITDEEPYYGEIPELPGVWATGMTLEECRKNLAEVVDGWIIVRLRKGLSIPSIDNITIEELTGIETGAPA